MSDDVDLKISEVIDALAGITNYDFVYENVKDKINFNFNLKYNPMEETPHHMRRKLEEELKVIFWGLESQRIVSEFGVKGDYTPDNQISVVIHYRIKPFSEYKALEIRILLA